MGRAKARMEMITNKKARRVAFEKRRKGLEKKARELSTLCGVRICLIVFGPVDDDQTIEPRVWPQNPQEIDSLVDSFKKANLDDCRGRTTDFSFFYQNRKRSAEEELARLRKKNLETKHPTWDEKYDFLSLEELGQFDDLLKEKVDIMKARVDFMKGTQTYFAGTSGNLQYLYRSRDSSTRFEIPQPQPLSSFDQNRHSLDSAFQDSYNYNSMANPQMMMWMNNGASSSINAPLISYDNCDHRSLVQFNMDPTAAATAERITSSLGNNAVGNQFCYYVPKMQPMPLYLQYSLQQSRAPTQMYASQRDENYGFSDFELMNPK
ncbi:uncharacterized protein [Coffea arabica]|uniref:MADS-box domain-containing protein n=1 Tax=Coffea arabica TaxID=13443 RepID=A0A6P6U9P5_COFAR|nr:floral homeotic protein AGAMOUS-like [Coffea arabica]